MPQSACVVTAQRPLGKQQAPVATFWQVVNVQNEPAPWKTPLCAAQSDSVVSTQKVPPLPWMQQAPTLIVQLVELQVVPSPRYTPCAAVHCSNVNTWQVIPVGVGIQHAPVV